MKSVIVECKSEVYPVYLISTCTSTDNGVLKFQFNGYFKGSKIKKVIAIECGELTYKKGTQYMLKFYSNDVTVNRETMYIKITKGKVL